jgi:pyruvate/2-oxoglutarate dehydrogenase complex dihydrolipoamide dehydrogenase (E3) component
MIDPQLNLAPDDEHNRSLVANVHPPDWRNPIPEGRYNLVVLGAGTAGLVAAAGAAGMGAKVALIERHLMGGDCLNVGCVPSKAVIRSAHAVQQIREAQTVGVYPDGEIGVDFGVVMERVRAIRAGISPHDSAQRFSKHYGIDVFFGDARFTSPDTVEVAGAELRFAKAVIATGARAAIPPIPGLEGAGYLTNATVFNLTELPRRMAVLGGGPIGSELAQAFVRLGSDVTIVEMSDRFFDRADHDAAALLQRSLIADGVTIRLSTILESVEQTGGSTVLQLRSPEGAAQIEVDRIVVAAGRTANTEGLELEAAGVKYDRRGVQVNDFLQTSNRRIFASGDVCLPYQFTHTADAASRIVIQNALFPGPKKKLSRLVVPWCTYSDPEIAHVGLSLDEARHRGIQLDTYEVPMKEVDRAVTEGETDGFLKIHCSKGSDRILGATVAARHAGEMISEITTAMVAGIKLGTLSSVIHPYPTRAEAIRKAADAYNRTRLTPTVASIMKRWFAWTR